MSTAIRLSSLVFGALVALALGACAQETDMTSTNARSKQKSENAAGKPIDDREPGESADDGTDAPPETDDPIRDSDGDDDGAEADGSSDPEPPVTPPGEAPVAIEREFPVTEERPLELVYEPDLGILSQDVTLRRAYQDATASFQQVTRSTVVASHTQGTSGTQHQQVFAQNQMGILDIQVVIDDSLSMASEQELLANNLPPLLSRIANSNWRMNIVTTDVARGCSRALINKGDANAEATFATAINAGLDGASNEEGIRMAVEGLRCASIPAWVRDQSTVAVLIVSDEDNCSNNGGDCPGKAWNTHTYLTSGYLGKAKSLGGLGRQLGVDARVYSIIRPDSSVCIGDNNKVGYQYVKASNETLGIIGRICDKSYESTLTRISEDIATTLKGQFELALVPDAGTLVVRVNGVETTSGFTLQGKILTFQTPPPFGAEIRVNYVTGMTQIKTRFALGPSLPSGLDVVPQTLAVAVNGQAAAASSYSYDASTKELVFKAPPVDLASIVSTFKVNDKELLTQFSLGTTAIMPGSIQVKVNDQATTAFTYASGVVTFTTPPVEGAQIVVAYARDMGPVLVYPVTLTGSMVRAVAIVDKATDDAVAATYAAGSVTVDASAFVAGRVLSVRYKNEDSGKMETVLPQDPIPGSVTVETGRNDCKLGQGITLVGKTLSMDCDWNAGDKVVVALRYALPPITTFLLAEVSRPEAGEWEVFVNGVATTAYLRTGSIIQLTTPPPAWATVKIVYKTKAS